MYSVLMVDDNAAIREALARSLTRRGCRVTTAASGVEGLEALKQRSFDIVVTDLNMPERGGLWLWEQALAVRPELRGRFVLISSEARAEQKGMGLFLESEHFFVKPFSLTELMQQVEDLAQQGSDGSRRDGSGGPAAGDGHDNGRGVLPDVTDQVEPGLEDDEERERKER